MLPKNNLRKDRLARLFVFPESEHPYEANIITRYDSAIDPLKGRV
jgi:large subunit ribosomal protein L13